MSFFYSKPKSEEKMFSVADVQDKLQAFNVMYEMSSSSSANCRGPEFAANWRKAVRQGVVNTAGGMKELNFFEQIAGGPTTEIDATDLYVKSLADVDFNIHAESNAQGGAPGAFCWFYMAKSLHVGGGKYSNVTEGGSIYVYDDDQFLYITEVDRTVDYAHRVKVFPGSKDYQVNIKAGRKMFFNPARTVGGVSCPAPSATWMTDGYIAKVQPWRVRQDYKFPKELDRPYQEVLQFGIIFDENGKEVDGWEWKEKIEMRKSLQIRKNINFFIGQKIDNPALIGAVIDAKYPGFEGYVPSVRYGGGTVYDFPESMGFSLRSDFTAIMLRQDAKKLGNEFLVMAGFPFMLQLENRGEVDFSKGPGQCTFETFRRVSGGGADGDAIRKLGIKSYSYGNFSLHFKEISALSDSRFIGNGKFPNMAMMMPTEGLTDSNGRSVPPIEFFLPKGMTYKEVARDMEVIDGCEYLAGHAIETSMMAVHGVNHHYLLNPESY